MKCPHCESEKNKTLDKGKCRVCGGRVFVYNKKWTAWESQDERVSSPTVEIVNRFIELMQMKLPEFDLEKGTSEYIKEVGFAKLMLTKCGGNLDYALIVLEESYKTSQKFSSILNSTWAGFPTRLAKAKRKVKAQQKQSASVIAVESLVNERAHLFDEKMEHQS